MTKILVAIFAYNEGEKLKSSVSRHPKKRDYDLLIMDDGSTDLALDDIPLGNILVLKNISNRGIGFSMKKVFRFALSHDYDVIVIQGGNNKDNPLEIPDLLKPILSGTADFVQGSRYLNRQADKSIPLYRQLATRLHPLLFSMAVGKKVTESTNGFRAFRTKILKDPKINWQQDWLNKYELEPYLLYKTITASYRHVEVPVTKIYPPKKQGYTKMRPLIDWWSILKPIIYLGLGLRK